MLEDFDRKKDVLLKEHGLTIRGETHLKVRCLSGGFGVGVVGMM